MATCVGETPPQPREDRLRVASFNSDGITNAGKRRELVRAIKKAKVDVTGIQETHVKGCGVYGQGDVNEFWEGVEGGMVLCGMEEKIEEEGGRDVHL